MTTPTTTSETTATTNSADDLRQRFPFRAVSPGCYVSADGKWTCTKQEGGRWTLRNNETGEEIPGLAHVMAARSYLAGLSAAPVISTPTAPGMEAEPVTTKFSGDARLGFRKLMADLNGRFKERKEIVQATMAAILVGENLLYLGPPGTGKSALARAIAQAFGGTYFERLLTKQSKPDELFGPPSLQALREGRYEREIQGWLPTVNFGLVDETFKGSPAILNGLLALMNERIFHNGAVPVSCPLVTLFGASNELPESKELDAVFDRFLVRLNFGYIDRDAALMDMLDAPEPTASVQLSLDILRAAQAEVAAVKTTESTKRAIVDVRNALKSENIIVSDRRFKKVLKLTKAFAWLDGETETSPEYLAHCVSALWSEPKQVAKITKVVGQFADSVSSKCDEIVRAAEEKVAALSGVTGRTAIAMNAKAVEELREMFRKLDEVKAAGGSKAKAKVERAQGIVVALGEKLKENAKAAAGL